MSSRGSTVVKLKMTPYFWRLLGKYSILLSVKTMARGGKRMSLTGTVSGIVSTHLLRHAEWIETEFSQLIREVSRAQVSGYSLDYVDAVASAPSEAIPDVVRAGADPKRLSRLLKTVRPLLQFGRPSRGDAQRPAEGPRKVRRTRVGVSDSSRARGGTTEARELELFRHGDFGSGDDRPEPELLKKAVQEFAASITPEEAVHLTRSSERRKAP